MAGEIEITVAVDGQIKRLADDALRRQGLALSAVLNSVIVNIAETGDVPRDIGIPNQETRAALAACERGEGVHFDRLETALGHFDKVIKDAGDGEGAAGTVHEKL